ncbi:MAG: FtsX-like permease family protein [Duncaniella sp.]|nr:FtsX-like permease family protein [Duncaniella sp.]
MFKLILKNICANRGRNLLVMAELILIAAVAWIVLEPVVVNKYLLDRDLGYDTDRLVRIEIGERYTDDEYTSTERYDDLLRLLARLRAMPGVEAATMVNNRSFESQSINANSYPCDSTGGAYFEVEFIKGQDFFKTFGIHGSDGKVFNEPPMNERDRIVSRGMGQVMHPGVNPVGHYINEYSETYTHGREDMIVGVVEDVIYRSEFSRSAIVYMPKSREDIEKGLRGFYNFSLVARLKPGVDPADFVRDNYETISRDLSAGRAYAHSPMTYTEFRDIRCIDMRKGNFLMSALALFLIVNLFLCVTGTFYLQTRDRSRDAGIMRAFGASRASICINLIAEGWVMTIVAWLIGCAGVYLWGIKDGLSKGSELMGIPSQRLVDAIPMWIDNFAVHFGVVSVVVLVLMLMAVTIGIYLPARNIARVSPVDALREE